jgi:hypothetical protein
MSLVRLAPLLSVPETFKVDDFIITRQIQELNYKIWEINDQLNKTSVKISKYYFRGRKNFSVLVFVDYLYDSFILVYYVVNCPVVFVF